MPRPVFFSVSVPSGAFGLMEPDFVPSQGMLVAVAVELRKGYVTAQRGVSLCDQSAAALG